MTLRSFINFKINALNCKIRAWKYFYFFKNKHIIIGKNLTLRGGVGKHIFGLNNVVFDNCIFEAYGKNTSITTGRNCIFSYGVLVACAEKINIGNYVWVGEYTSIRDSTHNFSSNEAIGSLSDSLLPIKIGNNVWIGRGCLIMLGTVIEDNVIIAANSVVKGHCKANSMYGGSPARFIKSI